jgi:flagellar motility protein MotE (MotC chaperone)
LRVSFKGNRIRGSLAIVVSLFICSAIFRIALNASEALAQTKTDELPTSAPAPQDSAAEQTDPTYLQAILKREQDAKLLEAELATRKKALDVAKFEIERRIDALKEAESQLSATLSKANTAAEDDVLQLLKVYETMKPKDSAALFEAMEPTFAAGFLGRMRPDAAANIMAGLDPKVAYTISIILAGRNANAPKD